MSCTGTATSIMLVWTNWRTRIVLPREGVSHWIGRPTEERAGRPQCPVFVGLERTWIARPGRTHLFRMQFIIFPSERRRKLVSLLFCRPTAKFRPRIVSTTQPGYRARIRAPIVTPVLRFARGKALLLASSWYSSFSRLEEDATRHRVASVNCALGNTVLVDGVCIVCKLFC